MPEMPNSGDFAPVRAAFTIAPYLQTINYRVCFSPFAGIWSVLATPHQG
jgi:hypothetical protein